VFAERRPLGEHVDMEIRPGLAVPDEAVAEFCDRHGIRRLAVFGSALREDFRDDSDVDVLVEFQPGYAPGLLALAAMELELGELLDREVELRTYEDLSRYFRDRVRASARELYAAA
jgi:predicted nucleotidyltransferase